MPHRVSLIPFVIFLAGCGPLGRRPMDTASAPPVTPLRSAAPAPADSIYTRPVQRLTVYFMVHRFSAPAGTFGQDEGLWKLATGPLASAAMAMHLEANGIRAAVGRESDRAALKAHLEGVPDLQQALDESMPDAARLLEVEIGPCPPSLAVFYYDPAGHVRGLDFQGGNSRFKIGYELRFSNLEEVWLELVPEIEEPAGPPRWLITEEGTAQQVPDERRYVFNELLLAARIPPGGFLLLGCTPAVYERPLVGRPLFVQEVPPSAGKDTMYRESIYVISPMVQAADNRASGLSRGSAAGRQEGR